MAGAMPHRLFDSADGATLFAAMILFPVSIFIHGVVRVVLAAWNMHKRSKEQLRKEGRKEGQEQALSLALRADKERLDGESLEQAMERLRALERF